MDKQAAKKKKNTFVELSIGIFIISQILIFGGGYAHNGDLLVIIGLIMLISSIVMFVSNEIIYINKLKQNVEIMESDIQRDKKAGKDTTEYEKCILRERDDLAREKRNAKIIFIVLAAAGLVAIVGMVLGLSLLVGLLKVFTAVD